MLKRFLMGFVAFAVILLAGGPSLGLRGSSGTVWDVTPDMTLGQIQAVVDAASNGDTVYFHAGTYDWSGAPLHPRYANEGAITIVDKTLTIVGEPGNLLKGPDSIGPPLTMMGCEAFHVVDEDTDDDVSFIGLNIHHFMRGINVDKTVVIEPGVVEYNVPNARNVTIKNCTITDSARQAIDVFVPQGNVLIQNNTLQGGSYSIYLSYEYYENMVPVSDGWQPDGTRVVISGNTITSFNIYGILGGNVGDFRVENNTLVGNAGALWAIDIWGTKKGTVIAANAIKGCRGGIAVEGAYGYPYDHRSEGAVVEGNKISVSPASSQPNSWCGGIEIDGDLNSAHRVVKNDVTLISVNGIGIYADGHDGYVGLNKVSGTGQLAVYLGHWNYGGPELAAAHHETFQANNVSQFRPSWVHFYLDYLTHDNVIFGSGIDPVTYQDDGTNNRITGMTPMKGGIGKRLQDLRAQALAEAKAARSALF